ncbi:hypothetical protein [Staphylococcus argensis]|uniref:Lipoprotein n=1 Tax=Staphylococcus argensis TaxID=1607738 RepID=A0A2K4FDR6_9STAP|nr:hypothetical protein [Staphylococcus argensis]MCY6990971.1 hypothetical protein [Staphylococcus argensis]POA09498.1 hypothetical protein CD039_01745 [Staphylococcus argensis]
MKKLISLALGSIIVLAACGSHHDEKSSDVSHHKKEEHSKKNDKAKEKHKKKAKDENQNNNVQEQEQVANTQVEQQNQQVTQNQQTAQNAQIQEQYNEDDYYPFAPGQELTEEEQDRAIEAFNAYAKKHGLTDLPAGDAMFPMPGTEKAADQPSAPKPDPWVQDQIDWAKSQGLE